MSNKREDKQRELKPCPFCGSKADFSWSSDFEVVNVRCERWGKDCMGAGANVTNEEDAACIWNRRAPVSARATHWEDEARRYAQNADFWREKYESALSSTAPSEPKERTGRQYYYKNNDCKAPTATHPDCICWHDEGQPPIPVMEQRTMNLKWRDAPRSATVPHDGSDR